MSFQRSLTGESAIYANVMLNTNVCANSVSTVNLSATNASFTNITTNTWTAGNVSTPNVIATDGYISNLYMSNFNASFAYMSNLSVSNISVDYISLTTRISAPTIEDVGVIKNTNSSMYLYSSGGIIVRGWNQSDAGSLNLYYASTPTIDAYGMNLEVAKEQGTTRGYSRITAGENLSFQVYADTQLQLENTSLSGWRYYSSLNSSYLVNLSYASIKNICCGQLDVNKINISSNNGIIGFTRILNGVEEDYGGMIYDNSISSFQITGGYHTSLTIGSVYGAGSGKYAFLIDVSNRIYNPSYSSIYSSNLNVSNLSVSTATISNVSVSNLSATAITVSTIDVTSGFSNLSTINLSVITINNLSNISTSKIITTRCDGFIVRDNNSNGVPYFALNYDNTTLGSETYGLILEADEVDGAIITAGYNLPLTVTLDGVSQLYNTCAGGFVFYNTINNSFQTNLSNLNVSNLTLTSATIPTINSTSANISNASITNLSTTLISNSSRISTSSISVSNISIATKLTVQNISMTTGGAITGSFDIAGTGTLGYTSIAASFIGVTGAFGVSARNMCSVSAYISYVSVSNLSGGTLQATTANFSTLNASTFALTNLSLTNLSVANDITVSDVSVSAIQFGNSSLWGSLTKASNIMFLNAQGGTDTIWFGTLGAQRLELSQTQAKFNVCILAQRGNFSTLSVSTFNPATITTTTVTASTINASAFNVSTFNPASITTNQLNATYIYSSYDYSSHMYTPILENDIIEIRSTSINASGRLNISTINVSNSNICNISTSYISAYSLTSSLFSINSLTSGLIAVKSQYDMPTLSWSTSVDGIFGRMGGDLSTSTFDLTVYPFNVSDFNLNAPNMNVCVSSLNFCNVNGSLIAGMDMNACRFYISNISVSNLSVKTLSVSNIYTSNLSSPNISMTTITGTTVSVTTTSTSVLNASSVSSLTVTATNLSITKINNSFTIQTTTQPLSIMSVSNDANTGIRLPNYIDGSDTTTGLFIGYNHTGGFVNVCRTTRVYGNVTTDGNLNTITNTATLGIGQNITSGDIKIGSTTMTGNISIDTAGDCVFGCDRRSTWNTSNLLTFSTQIGSGYQFSGLISSANLSGTGTNYLFYPTPANVSLLDMPVGLYMVTVAGSYRGFNGYNAIPSNCYAGICYGTNASFTSANTTRFNVVYNFAPNLYSNASTATVLPFNFAFPFNMSITGQKLGAFAIYQATNLATAGSVQMNFFSLSVTKIA